MLTEKEKAEYARKRARAIRNAKRILKVGDRLRAKRCSMRKTWIIFAKWDDQWIVSKSGIKGFHPLCIDRLNGEPIDFAKVTRDA